MQDNNFTEINKKNQQCLLFILQCKHRCNYNFMCCNFYFVGAGQMSCCSETEEAFTTRQHGIQCDANVNSGTLCAYLLRLPLTIGFYVSFIFFLYNHDKKIDECISDRKKRSQNVDVPSPHSTVIIRSFSDPSKLK